MDLISRQEVINGAVSLNLFDREVKVVAVDYIESLPTIRSKWVPCSERLPEVGQSVLTTSITGKCGVWICHPYREDDYMWEDDAGYLRDKHDAVAWMPLPEAYEEK